MLLFVERKETGSLLPMLLILWRERRLLVFIDRHACHGDMTDDDCTRPGLMLLLVEKDTNSNIHPCFNHCSLAISEDRQSCSSPLTVTELPGLNHCVSLLPMLLFVERKKTASLLPMLLFVERKETASLLLMLLILWREVAMKKTGRLKTAGLLRGNLSARCVVARI